MTQVVIDDIIPRTQLIVAIAAQTVFNTNWTANATTDIDVYARADGVEPDDATQLVSPSLYTVTLVGISETVRITFLSGRSLDDVITIVRNTPSTRLNLYINTNFLPSMLNQDFGILTLIDQQAQMYDTVVNPGYNVSAIIGTQDKTLPILGPNQIWAKNAANDAIVAYDVPAGGGLAPDDGKYLIQTADADLPDAQIMGDLASGLVVNTNTTGVQLTRLLAGTTNQLGITNPDGIAGNPTYYIVDNPIIPGTAGMGIPEGTTAERVIPVVGIGLRFNTDLSKIEFYNAGIWTQLEGGAAITSIQGTANQILANGTSGTPETGLVELTLPTVMSAPGTFTIQGTTAVDAIINDSTLGTATATNLATAAALKFYIDSVATGLNIQAACVVMAPAALTVTYANGASGVGATLTNAGVQAVLSLDGVSPSVGQRVLITQQASTLQNGIYTVTNVGSGATNWVLTRATDFDTPSEIQPGDFVVVNTGGTLYGGTSWIQTSSVVTVGTDPITFVQFGTPAGSSVTSVSGTLNRITSSGGLTPIIDISASYVGQTSITTLGTITTGTWQGSVLSPTYGGTGITSLGTGVASALGSNASGSGGLVRETSPTITTPVIGSIIAPSTVGVAIDARSDGSTYAAGKKGYTVSSNIPVGTGPALATGADRNVTSITLPAGNWLITGNVGGGGGGAAVSSDYYGWINTVSASQPDFSFVTFNRVFGSPTFISFPVPPRLVRLTVSTTFYLSINITFTSTATGFGNIYAVQL